MSYQAVMRKDFKDGIRSYLLLALVAMFVLLVGGTALLLNPSIESGEGLGGLVAALGAMLIAIVFLVPLTGLVVSIKSITKERELGSIKVLLSLPHTRGEVILGKFLGRSGLLTAAILAGFIPAGLLFIIKVDNFPVVAYLLFVLVAVLFGLAFVAVGIGISAFIKSDTKATVAGIAAFFLLYFWTNILNWINGEFGLFPWSSDAYLFIQRFNLLTVFFDALLALWSVSGDGSPTDASVVVWGNGAFIDTVEQAPSQPIYLQQWFAFGILALWIVVPLGLGYYRFQNADL